MYVDIGFKAGERSWRRLRRDDPSFGLECAHYVNGWRRSMPLGRRWAGFAVSVLGYENEDPQAVANRACLYRFVFDVDCADDLARAQAETIRIVDWLEEGGCTPRIKFSGSKGFHVEVPWEAFQAQLDYHEQGHQLAQALHATLLAEIGLDARVVDGTLWARRKLLTQLNVPHPSSGLYAIPLSSDELRDLTIARIRDMATQRRTLAPLPCGWHDRMSELFEQVRQSYLSGTTAAQHAIYGDVSRDQLIDLDDIPERYRSLGYTPCVASLVRGPTRNVAGEWNALRVGLAAWCVSTGLTESQAEDLLTWIAREKVRSSTREEQRVSDARQAVRWAYSGNHRLKPVTCSNLRARGLDCTNRCPFHEQYQKATAVRRAEPSRRADFTPQERPQGVSIGDCRAEVREAVTTYLTAHDGDESAMHLKVPAGGGKTSGTLAAVATHLSTSLTPQRLVYVAPRHELIEQAQEWYPVLHHIEPRSPDNCERSEWASILAKRGYHGTHRVCRGCPQFEERSCAYLRQFEDRGHWAMTTDMAVGTDYLGEFDVVVLDESIVAHCVTAVRVDRNVVIETVGDISRGDPSGCDGDELPRRSTVRATIGFGWDVVADREWIAVDEPDPIQADWRRLCDLLTYRPPRAREMQGVEVAEGFRRDLVRRGVVDPEASLAAMLRRGVVETFEAGVLEPELLPPRDWIEPVIRALLDGFRLVRERPEATGAVPLRVEVDGTDWSLTVTGVRHLKTTTDGRPTPKTILLDATGSSSISARLLERQVREHRVYVPNDPRQVTQITDAKYARSTLLSPRDGADSAKRVQTWARVVRMLTELCRSATTEDLRPGRTLIISYQKVEEWLNRTIDDLGGSERVTLTHYWGNRGTDYSDHDQVILLGYPYPDEQAAIDQAAAIYQGEDLDTTVEEVWVPYLHGDGRTGIEVRRFRDDRVQAILEEMREAEFYQSAMRVRPLSAEHKRVVLLTSVPMRVEDGLEVGQLIRTQEIFEAQAARERSERPAKRSMKVLLPWWLRRFGWVSPDVIEGFTVGTAPEEEDENKRHSDPYISNYRGHCDVYFGAALLPSLPEIERRLLANPRYRIPFTLSGHRQHRARFGELVHETLDQWERETYTYDQRLAGERVYCLTLGAKPVGQRGRMRETVIYCLGLDGLRKFLGALRSAISSPGAAIYFLGEERVTTRLLDEHVAGLETLPESVLAMRPFDPARDGRIGIILEDDSGV